MSYANAVLYGATFPSYNCKDKKEDKDIIKADDPRNNNIIDDFLANVD